MSERWIDAIKVRREARLADLETERIHVRGKGNYVFNAREKDGDHAVTYKYRNDFSTYGKKDNSFIKSFFQPPLESVPNDKNGKYGDGNGVFWTGNTNEKVDIYMDLLDYLNNSLANGGGGNPGYGFNPYGGNGKPGDIDDEVERSLFKEHWLYPEETFKTNTVNGDTIFSEYQRYKWDWGNWEYKKIKLTIINNDTIKVERNEERNGKQVPNGSLTW